MKFWRFVVRTNKLLQGMLLLGLFMVGTISVSAQALLDSYINERVGIWRPLENPTEIGRGDDPWGQINLPFNFRYDNQTINSIYVYGNGFISLNEQRSPFGQGVPDFAEYRNLISWYGADLYTNGMLSYKVTGTEPFRVLTVEQTNARTFLDFSGARIDVQVKFFETTNEIHVIYGAASGVGGKDVDGALYFSGSGGRFEYINIKPENPIGASTIYKYNDNPNTNFWLSKDVKNYLPSGKTYILSPNPVISEIRPGKDDILVAGELYEGDDRPYVRINRGATQEEVAVRFKISGPLPETNPDYKTIYVAVNEDDDQSSELVEVNPQPVGDGIIFYMPHAKDIAGRLSDGALDLITNEDDILGGEYEVEAILELPDVPGYSQTFTTTTNVALSDDIAITDMESPSDDNGVIYSISSSIIPVRITVKNLGRNPVTQFKATAKIYKDASLIETLDPYMFDDENNPLEIGESMEVRFPDYVPDFNDGVGEFTIVTEVELLSAAEDKLPANNIFPRENDPDYTFDVGYEIEAEALELLNPAEEVYLGSPIVPSVKVKNNGVSDVNDADVTIRIVSPSGTIYEETTRVDVIPHGLVNEEIVFFDETFVPDELGTYDVTITVNAIGDEDNSNDVISTTFVVEEGMKGEYHITANAIEEDPDRVFATIQDAVDTLFLQGVSGDVTFYLYDADYNVGDKLLFEPALDLSSKIIGVSHDATVKFMPHESVEDVCNIHLATGNGIGVLFGQNTSPDNQNAPVNRAIETRKSEFSDSEGFIIFDGDDKKLNFMLDTDYDFNAVFYLGDGASRITIKDVNIMGNGNFNCTLPRYSYNATLNQFTYDNDLQDDGRTYTAGVVLRSKAPIAQGFNNNRFEVDTLFNTHNMIENNNISGFGYGIVSIGIGALRAPTSPEYLHHHNHDNKLSGNTIHNVSKAGIFLGNEKNSEISGNRIYDVHGSCEDVSGGILLGANTNEDGFGFHNVNITIDGNEISGLEDGLTSFGILAMQQLLIFDDLGEKFVFPDNSENLHIINNIIWGFEPVISNGSGINKIGIGIYAVTEDNEVYRSREDLIANNTIVIEDDGTTNDMIIAGIFVQLSEEAELYNNAIAVLDDSFDWENTTVAAVIYEGLHPERSGMKSDNNAFMLENEDAQIYRFVELDRQNRIVERGFNKEFIQLDQWRYWTNQDWNSTVGDFVKDHEFVGFSPANLRIKTHPFPFNSILNLRGKNVDAVPHDFFGISRGDAGEIYDIGAIEFNGEMSDRDIEIVAVKEPGSYKATHPMPFSDVEYVMISEPTQQNPHRVVVTLRNNSNIMVGGIPITMNVKREGHPLDSIDFADEFTIEGFVNQLDPGETVDVVLSNPEFSPKTYAEFRSPNQPYNIPDEYKALEANVSPIYKYTFDLETDEIVSNNDYEKLIRFYIQKSNISLMVSARGIMDEMNPDSVSTNDIANNLNLDSLMSGFFNIGWFVDVEREDPVINIDVFDRAVWEPRSVNYPLYRTLFWVDGHDELQDGSPNTLTRYERLSIREFLSSGMIGNKKNFVMGSQEAVRLNSVDNADFINMNLRAEDLAPSNPLGVDADYDSNYVIGLVVGRDTKNMVKQTEFVNDDYPKPGLFKIYSTDDTRGLSRLGFVYESREGHDPDKGMVIPEEERLAASATTTLIYNTFHVGVDWRHWDDIETVLRAILDFMENNDGNIIPVELYEFNAQAIGDRVDITWKTASEYNVSHFELERAFVNNDDIGNFMSIENVDAVGNSSVISSYGPYVDWSISNNNTYAYRLKTVDIDGEYSYSEPVIVTLDGINDISISEAMPNPVTDISKINYTLNNAAEVLLALYDINGNIVAKLVDGNKAAGTYNVQINANNYPSGNYTLIYRVGNSMLSKSINIVK